MDAGSRRWLDSGRAMTESLLTALTSAVKATLTAQFDTAFIGLLQYGSTVSPPLKPATDVDLFAIVEPLPKGRAARRDLALAIEDAPQVRAALQALKLAGHHLQVSLVLRNLAEASKFSPLYLDWTDQSRILHDSKGLLATVIQKTQDYIRDSGARKVRHGLLWYWDMGQGKTANDLFDIGWL